jgi:carboxyl-terminal processing protease
MRWMNIVVKSSAKRITEWGRSLKAILITIDNCQVGLNLKYFWTAALLTFAMGPLIWLCLWLGVEWLSLTLWVFLAVTTLILFLVQSTFYQKQHAFWLVAYLSIYSALFVPLIDLWVLLLLPFIFLSVYLWGIIPLHQRRQAKKSASVDQSLPSQSIPQLSAKTWWLVAPVFILMYFNTLGIMYAREESHLNRLWPVEYFDSLGISLFSPAQYTCLLLTQDYIWRDNLPRWPGLCKGEPERVLETYRAKDDPWSHIVEADDEDTGEQVTEKGFGMRFEYKGADMGIIQDIRPGSQAERLGIQRGMRIETLNGEPADDFGLLTLAFGVPYKTQIRTLDGKLLEIAWDINQVTFQSAALPASATVLKHEGLRVGYLQYRHFTPGSIARIGEEIARLKQADISDLVIDLRQNGGGYSHVVSTIGTLISGERVAGKAFLVNELMRRGEMERNEDRFAPLGQHATLNLPRVVFLTSQHTCSASERLIAGLAKHIQVITVGDKTCGKPYSFRPHTFQNKTWLIVIGRTVADNGKIAYPQGIPATCSIKDDAKGKYGSVDDNLMQAALVMLATGRCPPLAL